MDKGYVSSVALDGREHLELTGVSEVVAFDEEYVELVSADGRMSVCGSGLKISDFDSASSRLIVDGRIDSITYAEDRAATKKSGLFSGLFR